MQRTYPTAYGINHEKRRESELHKLQKGQKGKKGTHKGQISD